MRRPVAHPTASRRMPANGWKDHHFDGITAAKDSLSSSSSRVSARQLDAIEAQLTSHDREVLGFVSEVRLASGTQLLRRFWADRREDPGQARAGRRALKRLKDWRVLDALPRSIGGVRGGSDALLYGVGVAGRRLLERRGFVGRRLGLPGHRHVAHTLALTELVVGLFRADRCGELDLIEVQSEPSCWRGYLGPMGARLVLKPDLFVRVGVGALEDRWMVELDMATEAAPTLRGKAAKYLSHYRSGTEQSEHGVYPRVLWAVPDARRAEQLREALQRIPAEGRRLFSVCRHHEVVRYLAAEASQ